MYRIEGIKESHTPTDRFTVWLYTRMTSLKMYTGIKEFDLSSSWGINNRDDLIQTIYQMTDDGHANDLAGLYLTWHRSSPEEWKALIAGGSERGLIYTQFVAQTAMCCGEGGIKAWDYVRMGFLSRVGVLNKWLTEDESLWLQSQDIDRKSTRLNSSHSSPSRMPSSA